jgi:hypothetical protein
MKDQKHIQLENVHLLKRCFEAVINKAMHTVVYSRGLNKEDSKTMDVNESLAVTTLSLVLHPNVWVLSKSQEFLEQT